MDSEIFFNTTVYLHLTNACSNMIGQYYSNYKQTSNVNLSASNTKVFNRCLQIL